MELSDVRASANAETVDLSTAESRKKWRDLLSAAGIRQCALTIPGEAPLEGEAAAKKMMELLSIDAA